MSALSLLSPNKQTFIVGIRSGLRPTSEFRRQGIQGLQFLLQQGNLQQFDGPQQQAAGGPSRDDGGQLPGGPNDRDGQAGDVAVVVLASQIIQQLADFVVG